MGTTQSVGVVPPTPGDILPFSQAGAVPTATGSGWIMQLGPTYSVQAMGTLATGTTTFNWGQYNLFTLTCYGGAMTFAFANVAVGQSVTLAITGAASAAVTWPTTFQWCGVIATPAVSASAPVLTSAVLTVVNITCISPGNYIGEYVTS